MESYTKAVRFNADAGNCAIPPEICPPSQTSKVKKSSQPPCFTVGIHLVDNHICITHCHVTTILLTPTPVLPKHSPHKQHTSCTAALDFLFRWPSAPVCLCSVLRYAIILSLFSLSCPICFLACFQNVIHQANSISFQLKAFQQ